MTPEEIAAAVANYLNPEGEDLTEDEQKERADKINTALFENQEAKPAWHNIQNQGFAAGEKKGENNLKSVKAELKTARAELEEAKNDLEKARAESPDLEKIHSEYQEKVDAAKERADKAEEKLKGERRTSAKERFRSLLNASLDDDYADARVIQNADRIQTGEDGTFVLQKAGGEARMHVPDGTDPIKALADEIIADTKSRKPRFLKSDVDDGGGSRGSSGSTGKSSAMEQAKKDGERMASEESKRSGKNHAYLGNQNEEGASTGA